ncbi:MAG: HupE/UreJ family protein [Verrucomicrobiia bacterium]
MVTMNALLAHLTNDIGAGFAAGFQHPWGGWDHFLAMLAVGLWAAQSQPLRLWKAPAFFVGGMIGGIFLAMVNPAESLVEGMIMASVVVSGLLLMFRFHTLLPVSLCLLAVFGMFHGAAHALERGDVGSGDAYFAGMVAGTTLLHAIGVLLGLVTERLHRGLLQAVGALMVLTVPLSLFFA